MAVKKQKVYTFAKKKHKKRPGVHSKNNPPIKNIEDKEGKTNN
jgi:hypothetical protein